MSFPMGPVKAITNLVIKETYKIGKDWVNSIRKYEENLENVKQLRDKLEAHHSDMINKVEARYRHGGEELETESKLVEEVDALLKLKEWDELLMDEKERKEAEKCCFGIVVWNPLYRRGMSLKAQKKIKSMEDKVKEMNQLWSSHVSIPKPPPERGVENKEGFLQSLKSRVEKVDQILDVLRQDKVNKIGIYGMGGAGKTTLVEEVARKAQNLKMFNAILDAEITQDPEIKRIQECLADRIGFSLDGVHTIEERARHLCRKLKDISNRKTKLNAREQDQARGGGKLLIILDNMWNKLQLHQIGICNEIEQDLQCKFIVSSRNKDVCKLMDATDDYIFEIGHLDPDEAELLFKKRVGEDIMDREGYRDIATSLLRKCSHLPLAINVLTDSLKGQSLHVWKHINRQLEKSTPGEISAVHSETYSIIETSYNIIPSRTKKQFFLLCCLFPIGSSINIDELLKYGIGLDLFPHVDSLVDAKHQAFMWLNEFLASSLLYYVDTEFRSQVGKETRIHDDVREAVKSIEAKGEDSFHVGAIPQWLKLNRCKQYAAISLTSESNYMHLAGLPLPKLKLLRLLNVCDSSFPHDYFRWMDNLKVLDLSKSDFQNFPWSIRHLVALETLLLEYTSGIDLFPICKLNKLQVLSLKGSDVKMLPEDIKKLEKLKVLDLTKCEGLTIIPAGALGCLTKLEGLFMGHSFANWSDGSNTKLSELSSLSLQVLEIKIGSDEQQPYSGDLVVPHLSKFSINLGESSHYFEDGSYGNHLWLKKTCSGVIVKPGWMSLMKKAGTLCLQEVSELGNVSPCLYERDVIALESLTITSCKDMEFLVLTSDQSPIFQKLKTLKMDMLPALQGVCDEAPQPDQFPNLQVLWLSKLKILKSYAVPVQFTTKLRVLMVTKCQELQYIFSDTTKNDWNDKEEEENNDNISFPCLQKLILKDLPLVEGIWSTTNSVKNTCQTLFTKKTIFPSLETLELQGLNNIDEVWGMTCTQELITRLPELQSIIIGHMPKLRHIWSKKMICNGRFSLAKLKYLSIEKCKLMESVCSTSIAMGFEQLEHLVVKDCNDMNQVISSKDSIDDGNICNETIMIFPKLLNLELSYLDNMRCFYQGSIKMEFSALQSISLMHIPKMKTFIGFQDDWGDINLHTAALFFDAEAMFPCLHTVRLLNMLKIKYVTHLSSQICHSFKLMKMINIRQCGSLKSFFAPFEATHSASPIYSIISFPELQELELHDLKRFVYFLRAQRVKRVEFPSLKVLKLVKIGLMERFVEQETWSHEEVFVHHGTKAILFNEKVSSSFEDGEECSLEFQKLEDLSISEMPRVKHLWGGEVGHFGSLENIHISLCEAMESVISPFSSQLLYRNKVIRFPALRSLHLKNLPVLKCFSPGCLKIEFQALNEINLIGLPLIKLLVETGKHNSTQTGGDVARRIDADNSCATKFTLFTGQVKFPCLVSMSLGVMPELNGVVLLNPEDHQEGGIANTIVKSIFPKFKQLALVEGDMQKWKNVLKVILQNLSSLEIDRVTGLKWLFSSAKVNDNEVFFHSLSALGKLEELSIRNCDSLEGLFGDENHRFPKLKILRLSKVGKLKGVPWHMLPGLQSIEIKDMDSLQTNGFLIPPDTCFSPEPYPLIFPELEELRIRDCKTIRSIIPMLPGEDARDDPSYPNEVFTGKRIANYIIELPKLRVVELENMPSLETFSALSCVLRLPCFTSMEVGNCGSLRSFSKGKLTIPKLKKIAIDRERAPVNQDLNLVLDHRFKDLSILEMPESDRSRPDRMSFKEKMKAPWLPPTRKVDGSWQVIFGN